tara:strand:- start:19029 stop:19247 length:219 start_codon:yes stop_codon:yes gene_type:complete
MNKIKKIKINLNGKPILINKDVSIFSIIKKIKAPLDKIAIELNKEIVNKKKIKKIILKKNDTLEIVHFIGGG